MRYFIILLLFLVGGLAFSIYNNKPCSGSPKSKITAVQEDSKMYKAIMEMRGNYPHIGPQYVKRLIREVREVSSIPGNEWMSPQDLMGLVMGESDLRWWIVTGKRGMWDCGIGQNHTPLFRRTYKDRWKLCQQLTKSTKLSLIYTMKELNTIRNKWCIKRYKNLKKINHTKWKYKQYRCIFNIYNQGPRFLTRKNCWVRYKSKNYTNKKYKRKLKRCLFINRYWLRSYCFVRGMELGRKPAKSCRGAFSLKWINRVYRVK